MANSVLAGDPSRRLKNGYAQDDAIDERTRHQNFKLTHYRWYAAMAGLQKIRSRDCDGLVGGLVVAGLAAVFAVHQAVGADADVDYCLAQAAEFIAFTRTFGHFALRTTIFGGAGSGAHETNVARTGSTEKMTLVTAQLWKSALTTAPADFCVAYNSQQ